MKNFYDAFSIFNKVKKTFTDLKCRLTKDIKIVPVVDEDIKKTLKEVKEIQNAIQTEHAQTQTDLSAKILKLAEESRSLAKNNEEILLNLTENLQNSYEYLARMIKIMFAISVISVILTTALSVYVIKNLSDKVDEPFQDIIENIQLL